MSILSSSPGLRGRIQIELSQWGYDIQVYGQTVMRAETYRHATRLAASLRRALRRKTQSFHRAA